MATHLPQIPDVTRLSPSLIRILGDNPSKFTLQGTNTYLLGRGPTRLLIDTGEGRPAWRSRLQRVLADETCTISDCVLTHWHHDHTEGVPDLLALCGPDVRVWKFGGGRYLGSWTGDLVTKKELEISDVEDGKVFEVGGEGAGDEEGKLRLRALHCPGHTVDHVALIIEAAPADDEDELVGAMFTGDNVLGHGTAVFEDLALYLKSLELMGENIGGGTKAKKVKAFPAHGEVIEDGKAKIEEYIRHRQQREDEVLNVLGTGLADGTTTTGKRDSKDDWSSMEIVKVVYQDVPENLHLPAEGGVLQVLRKLEGEGKVSSDVTGRKWRLARKAQL